MSEASANARQPQEFEKALSGSDTAVANFDVSERSGLEKVQHFLHASPAAVPLIVLVASLLAFAVIIGGRFFSAFSMTLILQQVAIVGFVGMIVTFICRSNDDSIDYYVQSPEVVAIETAHHQALAAAAKA